MNERVMDKHKVLVVGSRAVDSPELIEALRRRGAVESARVTLLVPAVPGGIAWAADMKAGYGEALDRADVAATQMRGAGIELEEAIVGDPDPFAAAGDVIHAREFDEVVVAGPPPGISGWLRPSLAERLRRETDVPVAELTIQPPTERSVPRLVAPLGAAS
jgi:nucleotide-binding universal stress UspA family protein